MTNNAADPEQDGDAAQPDVQQAEGERQELNAESADVAPLAQFIDPNLNTEEPEQNWNLETEKMNREGWRDGQWHNHSVEISVCVKYKV